MKKTIEDQGREQDVLIGQRAEVNVGKGIGESIFVVSSQELKSRLEDFLSSCPSILALACGCRVREGGGK